MESGKFVKLPCKIGEDIWFIVVKGAFSEIKQSYVSEILLQEKRIVVCVKGSSRQLIYDYKGNLIENVWEVYLDEEEAKKRLEELRNGNDN